MSFPEYHDLAPSGIPWLGSIPSHWSCMPAKRRFMRAKLLNTGMACEHRLALTMKGVIPRSLDDLEGLQASEFETYQVFEANDLAFKLIDLQNISTSRVGLVPEKGIMSPAYIRLRPQPDLVNPKFAYWFFTNLYNLRVFNELGGGVRQTLGADELLTLDYLDVPRNEQDAVSRFLDLETAKIDVVVEEQKRLIELLKEKRQAVISQAVTKGLKPNVPMKESGVPWLGAIPAHWQVQRGRFLFAQADDPPEEGDGVVTAFRDGQVTLRENRRTDGFTVAVMEVGYQHVRAGDLVIHGMDAFAGAIGVSESEGKCTPEYSVLRPLMAGLSNHYYAAALRLMALRNYVYVICPSVRERAPRFRYESFKDVWLPVPPASEQAEIMEHVDAEVCRLSELAQEAGMLISLATERRAAIISAAVTGKIDVRGLAPQPVGAAA